MRTFHAVSFRNKARGDAILDGAESLLLAFASEVV